MSLVFVVSCYPSYCGSWIFILMGLICIDSEWCVDIFMVSIISHVCSCLLAVRLAWLIDWLIEWPVDWKTDALWRGLYRNFTKHGQCRCSFDTMSCELLLLFGKETTIQTWYAVCLVCHGFYCLVTAVKAYGYIVCLPWLLVLQSRLSQTERNILEIVPPHNEAQTKVSTISTSCPATTEYKLLLIWVAFLCWL